MAVLILASQVPFDNPFGGNPVHVHVISLSEYETGVDDALDASLVSLLETSDLVGHNIKSDVSRLNWDFNLDILESHLTDTMPLAKVLFGPPVVWNPLSFNIARASLSCVHKDSCESARSCIQAPFPSQRTPCTAPLANCLLQTPIAPSMHISPERRACG